MGKISNISGIVLAGGKSSRIGRDKGSLMVGEISLAERSLSKMNDLFDEVIYVTNDQAPHPATPPFKIASDEIPHLGPLGGILAGLKNMKNKRAFIVAYDMPFVSPELVRYLIQIDEEADVVVPEIDGKLEPLHAVYGDQCVDLISAQLSNHDSKIINFYDKANAIHVSEEQIKKIDPDLRSFFNINTWDDIKEAMSIIGKEKTGGSENG